MRNRFSILWGKGLKIECNIAFMLVALFLYALTSSARSATLIDHIKCSISVFTAVDSGNPSFACCFYARGA